MTEKNAIPMSWDEVKEITESYKRSSSEDLRWKLGRSPSDLKAYLEAIERIKEQYVTVSDYIKVSKFNFEQETVSSGKLRSVSPPDFNETVKRLVMNDFPYNFAPGMHHYVLWVLAPPGSNASLSEADIEGAVSDLRNMGFEHFLYWVNPEDLKSIKDIDHGHIVCRKQDGGEEALRDLTYRNDLAIRRIMRKGEEEQTEREKKLIKHHLERESKSGNGG